MTYLLLFLTVATAVAGDVFYKIFDRKGEATFTDAQTFNLIRYAIPVAIIFIVKAGALSFPSGISLACGIIVGVSSVLASTLSVYSIKTGPLSLFVMIRTGSMAIPILYDLAFLGNKLSVFQIIGILSFFAALVLCAVEPKRTGKIKRDENESECREDGGVGAEKKKISFKWFLSSVGCMLLVGGNLVLMAVHKNKMPDADNELLLVSFICMAVLFGLICLVSRFYARVPFKIFKKESALLSVGSAGTSYANNLLVLMLLAFIAPSILYPTYYGGTVVFSALIAVIAFKERLTRIKWTGLAFGCVSLVLLQL